MSWSWDIAGFWVENEALPNISKISNGQLWGSEEDGDPQIDPQTFMTRLDAAAQREMEHEQKQEQPQQLGQELEEIQLRHELEGAVSALADDQIQHEGSDHPVPSAPEDGARTGEDGERTPSSYRYQFTQQHVQRQIQQNIEQLRANSAGVVNSMDFENADQVPEMARNRDPSLTMAATRAYMSNLLKNAGRPQLGQLPHDERKWKSGCYVVYCGSAPVACQYNAVCCDQGCVWFLPSCIFCWATGATKRPDWDGRYVTNERGGVAFSAKVDAENETLACFANGHPTAEVSAYCVKIC